MVVESKRKTVQHLEGGIIGEILVAEGARVRPGDPLVRLHDTRARSVLEGLRSRRDELLAREARLRAELDRANAVVFPAELLDRRAEPRVAALLAGQRKLFRRTTPTLSGDVVYVSADSLTDPRTGTASYIAHVAIGRGELEAAGGLELHPGMPAEVMIVTGRRTALDYLLAPIEESFARAFREE